MNPAARLCAYGSVRAAQRARGCASGASRSLGPRRSRSSSTSSTRQARQAPTLRRAHVASRQPQSRIANRPRLRFITPDRAGLPPLEDYASLQMPDGTRRVIGSTDATRGCKHLCRHCPIVPVYEGQFRVVPLDVVMADVRAQVAAGAQHISFGDPDFLNGPTHARHLVERVAAEFPGLSYDVTIKIEHLLKHAEMLPLLRETGCLFITSAVESIDDAVLRHLRKGHTRSDFVAVARLCREAGVTLVADVRRLHAMDDARGLRRVARPAGGAGPRRAGRADPARDPAAGHGGIAAARARRHPPRGVALRRGVADVAVAPSRSAGRRAAGGGHATRRRVSAMPRAEAFAAIAALAREHAELSGASGAARRRRGPVPVRQRALVLLRRADGDRCEARSARRHDDRLPDPIVRRGGGSARRSARVCERPLRSARRSVVGPRDSGALSRGGAVGRDGAGRLRRRRRIDGIVAVGDRPAVLAARIGRALGSARSSAGGGGDQPEQAGDARGVPVGRVCRRPVFCQCRSTPIPPRWRRDVRYPAVVKPLALSGSRGVMRVNTPEELRRRVRAAAAPARGARRSARARRGAWARADRVVHSRHANTRLKGC